MTGLQDKLADAVRSLRGVFGNPGLRRLQLAFAGSIVGDRAYSIAVAVYAYDHGGATAVGALAVIRYLALAIVTPFTSGLGDRYPRRLVLASADATRVVLVLAAAALIATNGPTLAVFVLAVVTVICGSPFRSAQAALLPDLAADPSELAAANVASATIESVGFFVGPALAGLMLAFTGIAEVYIFNAATFVWSALLVLGMRVPKYDEDPADVAASRRDRGGFLAEASAGYREIFGSRDLRLLVSLYCAQTIVAGASLVFTVSIALSLLDVGQSGLGFLNATLGIGGMIGGVAALVLVQGSRLARDFGFGVILWSAPLLLVAAWPSVFSAVVVMVVLGLANSIVDVNALTILQRLAPRGSMSRVFGAMESAVTGVTAVGALLMPALIATIGIRWGLAVVGTSVSAFVLFGIRGLPRIDTNTLAPPGLDLLRGVSLLAVLPEPTLESLARALVRVDIAPGEVLIRQGDEGDRFYVIESGAVEVTKDGRRVADLGPGDFVGEIALLRDVPRVATVTATSATTVQALDRAHFIPAVTGRGELSEVADVAIATRLAML